MKRSIFQLIAFIALSLMALPTWAQSEAPQVDLARAREDGKPSKAAAGPQRLFDSVPVSTRSAEARQLVEKSLDAYENVILDESLADARQAAAKDPKFALAFAMWSFVARRDQP